MKIIEVKSCQECPFIRYNGGDGGFSEPSVNCSKFHIILRDDNHYSFGLLNIHPKCKLKPSINKLNTLKSLNTMITDLQKFRSRLIAFTTNVTVNTPHTIISEYCKKCVLSRLVSTRNQPTKCCKIGRVQNCKTKCNSFTGK